MKGIPPTRTVSVGSATFDYIVTGTGTPTIVLVNGAGGPLEAWHRVLPGLAGLGTVFAYNRPGIGGSSKPAVPQTGEVLVEDLRTLLGKIGTAPPYVLVGHSLGGLVVNLFARRHPQEVSALVLLDATAPDDVAVMMSCESALQRTLRKILDRVFGTDAFGETTHVRETIEQIRKAPAFPGIPLIVVTGMKPAMSWLTPAKARSARARHQRELAALSPRGRQILAQGSGHFPQLSEPQVVIDAIREAARSLQETPS